MASGVLEVTEGGDELRARLVELCDVVLAISALDFNRRAAIKGTGDELDALAAGINALSEEVEAAIAQTAVRARLEAVLETISEGLIVFAPNGTVESLNREVLGLIGSSRKEAIGRRFDDLFRDDGEGKPRPAEGGASSAATRFEALVAAGQVRERRVLLKAANGATIPVAMNASVMRGSERILEGVVVTLRDLRSSDAQAAAQKRVDARLRQAERLAALGTLVAGVAHEVNNPLASVLGNTEVALEKLQGFETPGDDFGVRGLVDSLADSLVGIKRIRKIVRDLSVFVRGDPTPRKPIDVNRVVAAAIPFIAHETEGRATVITDFQDVPPVLADESHLTQVLVNLIANAAQAIPKGDPARNTIRLSTRRGEPERVIITVADTGPGLPDIVKRQLFTPFTTTREIGQGMGLGLSIVHGLVMSMGGDINVESEPGRGTVFDIAVPVGALAVPDAESSLESAADAAAARRRILLVDDDVDLGKAVQRMLSPDDVHTETSAEKALARIRAGDKFDAILCDILMPGMTGIEFFKNLDSIAADEARKVVFVTGCTCSREVDDFLARVGRQHIRKPFTRGELGTAISALVPERSHLDPPEAERD